MKTGTSRLATTFLATMALFACNAIAGTTIGVSNIKKETRQFSKVLKVKKEKKGSVTTTTVTAVAAPMTASAGGCMEEGQENCGPAEPQVIFVDYAYEPVLIEGKAYDDGWVTVCRGQDCAGLEIPEVKMAGGDFGTIQDILVEWSGVRDKVETMCGSKAANSPDQALAKLVSNTTSQQGSDPAARAMAAKAEWGASDQRLELLRDFASLSPSTWLDKYGYGKDQGYTITFTYSDGGTEAYKFKIYGGDGELFQVPQSLKPGNGASQCPK